MDDNSLDADFWSSHDTYTTLQDACLLHLSTKYGSIMYNKLACRISSLATYMNLLAVLILSSTLLRGISNRFRHPPHIIRMIKRQYNAEKVAESLFYIRNWQFFYKLLGKEIVIGTFKKLFRIQEQQYLLFSMNFYNCYHAKANKNPGCQYHKIFSFWE